MASTKEIKVSILIVTYNNAGTIKECLDSVQNQDFSDYEILVRDNKSTDDCLNILRSYKDIHLYPGEENIGFGAAMNFLSGYARGEYLFLLNPDCQCPNDLLRELYNFTAENEGVIAPALQYPDDSPQPSAREFPDYMSILCSRRSPLYQLGLVKTESAGYLSPQKTVRVPAVSATALFIKRNLFKAVSGFDERFFLYGEDLDLCKRLGYLNIDIWYLPSLKIKHILGASTGHEKLKVAYYHHNAIYKYFTKHFPGSYIKNSVLGILLLGGLGYSAAMSYFGRKRRK